MNSSATTSRRARALLLTMLLGALSLVPGCATAPPAEIGEFDEGQARALADQGNFRAAAAEYESMADDDRQNRAALLLRAAESLREEGDWAGVTRIADSINRKRLTDTQALRLELLLAERSLARDDVEGAWARLQLLPEARQPGARARQLELRARTLAARGDLLGAARLHVEMAALLEAGQQRANERDLVAVLARMPAADLQRNFNEVAAEDPLRPYIEQALRSLGSTPVRRLPQPTRAVGTLLPDAGGDWQREGAEQIERLALLVPLTGPFAAAGRAVRDGALAAHFADPAARVHLDVIDSGLTPASAVEAYVDAVTRGAQRVIGPLPREQVAAVFAQPQLPVPLLALNAGEEDAPPPAGSHVFGLAPEEEGAAIVQRLAQRGLRSPLVIVNHEDWSQRAARALAAHLELDGAKPSARIELPTGVDYGAVLDGVGALSFDAVVLALRPQQARLLLAQWRERGLPVHPWLATSHIYSGTPNRNLDRDLEGVEFCDAPWLADLASGLPARAALKRDLPTAESAPRLFALGLDAYRLVPYLEGLRGHPDAYLDGANGQLTVDAAGRVRRLPAWLRFVDGQPRATEGALLAQ